MEKLNLYQKLHKVMWQFAKYIEEQRYHPIEIIYQWGAEKPRLKVHGLNLIELQNRLKQEVEKFKNTRL